MPLSIRQIQSIFISALQEKTQDERNLEWKIVQKKPTDEKSAGFNNFKIFYAPYLIL